MRTLDSNTDAADQDFAKLVKASGSEYTTIATAGNFGDLCSIVLSTGETVYMASENSAAVNSDLKLPAIGSLGAAAGQASYLPSQPFRTVGASGQGYTRSLGRKVYELTDHLGNVHATVSDRRKYDDVLEASLPEVKSLADYYPFGMQMPGKKLNPDGYRYGYQRQERDPETGLINFKYRLHDARIGRFFAVDPLTYKFPWNSPYAFQENKLGLGVELEGLELTKQQSPTNDNIPMVVVDANWLKIQSTPATPDMIAIKLLQKPKGSANVKLNLSVDIDILQLGVELDGNKQEATVSAGVGDTKFGFNPSSKEASADVGNVTFRQVVVLITIQACPF